MMRTALVVGALLLGVGAVMAQQDLVKQNQDTMKANAKNLGAMIAMVKGEKPYDQAAVTAGLAQLEETAKKLPTMFPDSIKGMNPRRRIRGFAEDLGRQGRLQGQDRRASPRSSPRPSPRSRTSIR